MTPDGDAGYTTRVDLAVDEAEPYAPPVDPPVLPRGPERAEVAAGFAMSASEPSEAGGLRKDGEIEDEVKRRLRHDSATSTLPLEVTVEGGTAYLQGFVSDVEDAELAEAVAGGTPGVVEVVDETEVNPDVVEHGRR